MQSKVTPRRGSRTKAKGGVKRGEVRLMIILVGIHKKGSLTTARIEKNSVLRPTLLVWPPQHQVPRGRRITSPGRQHK